MRSRPLSPLARFRLLAYLCPLPAVVSVLCLLGVAAVPLHLALTLGLLVVVAWLGGAAWLVELYVRPLQTAANLLSAVREGDFSIRARSGRRGDPLGDLNIEINMLASILRRHRLHAIEATALVAAVMEAIDVAVFAIDEGGLLRLANPAGQRLLGNTTDGLLGRPASDFGLSACLEGEAVRVMSSSPFPGHTGVWGLRRCSFREEGRPHTLVVLADLSQALRAEQSKAWQSLVRVLGHELNNSLAPIKSIAGSLGTLVRRDKRPSDWEEDLRSGLDVIASRAEGLERFMQAYSRLARLPQPVRRPVVLAELVHEAAVLETRVPVEIVGGVAVSPSIDSAQIGQVLVNLLRNAAEATLEAAACGVDADGGPACGPEALAGAVLAPVSVSWQLLGNDEVEIEVNDRGIGISNTANLFVPFFTTKPEGSGIGLALSRQIAENHGGALSLVKREDGPGSVARLRLPLT